MKSLGKYFLRQKYHCGIVIVDIFVCKAVMRNVNFLLCLSLLELKYHLSHSGPYTRKCMNIGIFNGGTFHKSIAFDGGFICFFNSLSV